ncbi:MAG: DUF3520 domain-containing protein [Gemmatimonas sp.]|nr:DUF3520 domain-containing protein [Gemmatimonas sp.]
MKQIVPLPVLLLSLLAASVVAIATAAPSGPFVLFSGSVLDADTGRPLAGVQVAVEGTRYATTTRMGGRYRLTVQRTELSGGSVRLSATTVGFESSVVRVGLSADTVAADFRLEPSSVASDEASVVGEMEMAVGQDRAASAPTHVIATSGASLAPRQARHPYPDWNTESYSYIAENEFKATEGNPLSTLSIDVDRASYSNVRRYLLDGQLPPVDAVRIEEMINYFDYSLPTEDREHPFGVATEVSPSPWTPEHLIMRIGLASEPIETDDLPPSNLVFLLDVSGSMMDPYKLPLVKQSLRLLANELRPRDRVAIVVYAGAAGLALPSTPGNRKGRIMGAIESLEAGGSTAGGEGLKLAYRVAHDNHIDGGNNRVILATDGDFNVGVSSDSEMIRLVEQKRQQGTSLTVLGFGTGNLKDSKMEQMADHGNGNYAYIDSLLEARKVLVTEMGGTLVTVAKDVKLQVEFNPSLVRAYRLIGYENRLLAAEDFNDDTKDAGELGAGHTVTALYEVIPVGAETDVEVRGTDPLRYRPEPGPAADVSEDELGLVRVRYKQPSGDRSLLLERPVQAGSGEPSDDMRFATAVAGFGMLLRDSDHRGSLTAAQVIELARQGRGSDEAGYRADFIELVERYRSVADRHPEPPVYPLRNRSEYEYESIQR